jgi:hypothetical protein
MFFCALATGFNLEAAAELFNSSFVPVIPVPTVLVRDV